jgi:hypothetical protein
MKITTNVIGNYSPRHINSIVKNSSLNKTTGKSVDSSAVQTKKDSLTADEKNFFMDLYPQNKTDITDYHFYKRNGEMSGVKVGSLFDKKG